MAVDCSSNFSYKVQQWINSIPQTNRNSQHPTWIDSGRLRSATLPVSLSAVKPGNTEQQPNNENLPPSAENKEGGNAVDGSNGERPNEGTGSKRQWMKAMHSAHNSFSTCTTDVSSIDQLLDERRSDPEEVLMNLGFYQSNNLLSNKLPARFLTNKTNASGIDLGTFYKEHPDLEQAVILDSVTAMEQLYPRVPENFKKPAETEPQTSLHLKFSSHSNDDRYKPCTTNKVQPTTLYSSKDGQPYHTILTRQNSQTLEEQDETEADSST